MPSRRTRMLAPHAVACSLLAVGAVCITCSSALGEAPRFGAMLGETPLVACVPEAPLAVLPRVSIADSWPDVEHCSGERHGPAASPALLAPPGDEELDVALIPMPPLPHWSEQVTACAGAPNDRARRFDFLNPHKCSRETLLDPPAADERSAELGHYSMEDLRSPSSTGISAPATRIALPSKTTLEPLSISSVRRRPVAPSGTMYLWSTTSEMRAAQGHTAGGTSAGVVLTRPPGAYSIDWVGIAVTAPIQWR